MHKRPVDKIQDEPAAEGPALKPMKLADVYRAPGHLIRRCQQISVAIFFDEFKDWGVTSAQYAALVAIKERPGMEQRTLVTQIAIDRSTLGSMLRKMEEREFIRRHTPPENLRIKQLFILPAGEELLDKTRNNIFQVQERILAPLNAEERTVFLDLISKLVKTNNPLSRAPLRLEVKDL
jgi:MarR family transcriptional regulator, lower aerobic nicotinate degradation pathway regulator